MSSQVPRIFREEEPTGELPCTITVSDSNRHHLLDVLRVKSGEEVEVVCKNTATAYAASVISVEPDLILELREELSSAAELSSVRSLCFALSKHGATDLVVEKACELGVHSLLLWQSERSVVKLATPADVEKKIARWQRIIESACKQSKRNQLMEVRVLGSVSELTTEIDGCSGPTDAKLVCSLRPDAVSIGGHQGDMSGAHIVVGPEGDLTDSEEEHLKDQGFTPISLGPRVLRAETAAIVAIASVDALQSSQSL